MRRGFSLVELSIVLVILGLLVGGILAGQSLIRAAELRAVGAEYQRWQTATHAFRDKYFQAPGDFSSATRFWGRMTGTADCVTNSVASVISTGVCDGNGNGIANSGTGASLSNEYFQYWRHLALAGMIEGNYTGLAGPNAAGEAVIGTNVPASRIANTGWGMRSFTVLAGDCCNYEGPFMNLLDFGKVFTNNSTFGGGLKPEEAWNIDSKLDDGMPATGKAVVYNRQSCTNSTSSADWNSAYKLDSATTLCGFYFKQVF